MEQVRKIFQQIKWLEYGRRTPDDARRLWCGTSYYDTIEFQSPASASSSDIIWTGQCFCVENRRAGSTVLDVVENHGVKTAMLDVSFCLPHARLPEMPYKPAIVGATDVLSGKPTYRMGGNSCVVRRFLWLLVVRWRTENRRPGDFRRYDTLHHGQNNHVQRSNPSFHWHLDLRTDLNWSENSVMKITKQNVLINKTLIRQKYIFKTKTN